MATPRDRTAWRQRSFLRRHGSAIRLGAGEEKNALKELVDRKNLRFKVEFLGKVSDEQLAELYTKARATVFCSKNEPFGLVPVESMMHGTLVIAHKSGGPLETIVDNKTGYLYADDSELPKFLEKVITLGEKEYLAMQKASQLQAKEFDIAKSVAKLEEIIKTFEN